MPDISEIALLISVWALPILLAVTLHEAAHAYAARWLGDDTAHVLGRTSLNPLKHIDPVGTILLPGFLVVIRVLALLLAMPSQCRSILRG